MSIGVFMFRSKRKIVKICLRDAVVIMCEDECDMGHKETPESSTLEGCEKPSNSKNSEGKRWGKLKSWGDRKSHQWSNPELPSGGFLEMEVTLDWNFQDVAAIRQAVAGLGILNVEFFPKVQAVGDVDAGNSDREERGFTGRVALRGFDRPLPRRWGQVIIEGLSKAGYTPTKVDCWVEDDLSSTPTWHQLVPDQSGPSGNSSAEVEVGRLERRIWTNQPEGAPAGFRWTNTLGVAQESPSFYFFLAAVLTTPLAVIGVKQEWASSSGSYSWLWICFLIVCQSVFWWAAYPLRAKSPSPQGARTALIKSLLIFLALDIFLAFLGLGAAWKLPGVSVLNIVALAVFGLLYWLSCAGVALALRSWSGVPGWVYRVALPVVGYAAWGPFLHDLALWLLGQGMGSPGSAPDLSLWQILTLSPLAVISFLAPLVLSLAIFFGVKLMIPGWRKLRNVVAAPVVAVMLLMGLCSAGLRIESAGKDLVEMKVPQSASGVACVSHPGFADISADGLVKGNRNKNWLLVGKSSGPGLLLTEKGRVRVAFARPLVYQPSGRSATDCR